MDWQDISTAPVDRPFYARTSGNEIALCWRHRPSGRTDEILRWGFHRNRVFRGAFQWRDPDPLPTRGDHKEPHAGNSGTNKETDQ